MATMQGLLNQAELQVMVQDHPYRLGEWWKDALFLPGFASLASAIVLLWEISARRFSTTRENASRMAKTDVSSRSGFEGYIHQQGGPVILSFKILRLIGCLTLFFLSFVFISENESGGKSHQLPMLATYGYTSFLSSASLTTTRWSRMLTRHNIFVLLIVFGVYAYRDIWPLATYDRIPVDSSEGNILYAKLVALTVTAVLVPLFIPREYIPVDPQNPMEEPNEEQRASLFSLAVYSFLDTIIFKAYRVPHLPHTELPVLADYDYSKHLTDRAFPHLDPFLGGRKRHIFFGLMKVFYFEYLGMAIALILHVLANFGSPLAINRILNSLETDGRNDTVRPWIWVICLFFGPLLVSVTFQAYIYFGTITIVRVQAILTELVFEHSLRVRFKAETAEGEESKGAEQSEPSVPSTSDSAATAKKSNLVGKINTLVTVDLDNVTNAKGFLVLFIQIPLQLCLAIAFLYAILGWSAIVGFASIVALLPVPGYIARKLQAIQASKLEKTDARVGSVTETVGVLRMVKLFGWEKKMTETLGEKRNEELKWIWKDKMYNLLNNIVNFFIPTVTMLVTYATYTLIMGESLTASKVFSSMSVFEIIRTLLHRTSWMFSQVVRGKVSLDRLNNFLKETELLDQFTDDSENDIITGSNSGTAGQVNVEDHDGTIGFRNATFTWSNDESNDGSHTPSSRVFRLRINGSLTFKKGSINLIIGPTGAGKTSILMALLGEMHFIPTGVDSWYNLPRNGGVAYAAQESWVQNETIRDNILFGSPYNEERYKKVIKQCALERDLELFEAGDNTEVGEKGLTLSGGQKARVTLARAVYSSAEIILLDDILAALDVHTSKAIVADCLQGELIRGRTVLLVTHNVALTSSIADHVISIGSNGIAQAIGKDLSIALENDPTLASQMAREEEAMEMEEQVVNEVKKPEEKPDGKLILAEEIAEGHVSWRSLKMFLVGLAGDRPTFFFTAYLLGLTLMHTGNLFALWFLGYWGSQYESHRPEDIQKQVPFYLSAYTTILLSSVVIYAATMTLYNNGTIRASRTIHAQLMQSILGSTLRWLDKTPASRIITRCTQDIGSLDGELVEMFAAVVEIAICMAVKLSGPVFFTPIFLIPGILIGVIGAYIGNVYLKAQMSVKREMSNARAPVLGHFGAAIAGLTSIRAYGAQQYFRVESLKKIDHYTRVARTSYNLNRWISVRVDLLGATFTTGLASWLLVRRSLSASNIGFSLSSSLDFCSLILWVVRYYNDFEVQANSMERIQAYLEIEHEPKATDSGKPPASWPTNGDLRVEGLSSRYTKNGPEVLHNMSFHVRAGERIGIVGRTGSGKARISSLTLSLLRCILTEGHVYYDGLLTDKINLEDLRSKITIIPQIPELLSGTLRRNLDPFDQHDDATLNDALRASGLFSLQTESDEARLTLDSPVASGGNNLSVGQRQIIALARAMVRNSKLLILDEATSAIDHKTDAIIQESLRHEMGSDVTIITVAHRLQTIMDADQIMVLDEGRIVEYDSPEALLRKKEGYFKSLVDGSGDRQYLYEMAAAKKA
ncbi:hypothetical protein D9613_006273 [Agrocybe pediades]|uniref:P-loop containing nucleoside triphosphate hydrolase protein n=1 Tax=Agrocybe pediades TaxID=84607 RepID=A0A8H4QTW1_9AGAR|nr:hypothetical protein D9613_006273 [Agrocybe pediades]